VGVGRVRGARGTLRGDLRANAELVVRTLADPRQGAIFRAVIASAASGGGPVDAVHRFYCLRVEEWAGCVREAIDRGDLPADTDPHAVVRAVSAPLYYAMITTDCPLDLFAAHQAADAAHAAARAGALVCRPGHGVGPQASET
jgi:hypothetical protein